MLLSENYDVKKKKKILPTVWLLILAVQSLPVNKPLPTSGFYFIFFTTVEKVAFLDRRTYNSFQEFTFLFDIIESR